MEKLHPIMFAGTGSDVGKSIIAAAFCRIFKQDGYQPAPFKAQNMALNSFATPEGLEIGRAQAVQAEAAGVPCHTDMNPLLLKPQSDHTSQVVLNGRPIGNRNAYDYFRKEGRDELRREVCAAYDRLAARYNPVVLEGAGSISEINLRDTDLVNLPMALHAGADVILVGDIDRGGVFASVYGSLMLLRPHERERIKGILINKFRGDIRLFESGITMLEELCGIPVVGVVPYYRDIYIEEEDSVALAAKSVRAEKGKVNIAVILLRHLSNFTDFNVLERDPRVHLFYTNNVDELAKADVILLPGSKSTLDDLYELRRNGVAAAIIMQGYEIHMGVTTPVEGTPDSPLNLLENGSTDGYCVDSTCMGTYIHGILDNPEFIDFLLAPFADKLSGNAGAFDYHTFKEEQYDRLAEHVRRHVNLPLIYQILTKNHD